MLKLPRRSFLHLAAAAVVLPTARAQTYPARPVRIVVGFPAGTSSDITARLIGQWLSQRLEFIRAGKLRALAVTAATRQEVLPDIPSVGEFVPGWEIKAGLADPKLEAQLADLGGETFAGSPEDFASFIAAETEKWAKVVKFAGIKPG